jgi:hypothetical protein
MVSTFTRHPWVSAGRSLSHSTRYPPRLVRWCLCGLQPPHPAPPAYFPHLVVPCSHPVVRGGRQLSHLSDLPRSSAVKLPSPAHRAGHGPEGWPAPEWVTSWQQHRRHVGASRPWRVGAGCAPLPDGSRPQRVLPRFPPTSSGAGGARAFGPGDPV